VKWSNLRVAPTADPQELHLQPGQGLRWCEIVNQHGFAGHWLVELCHVVIYHTTLCEMALEAVLRAVAPKDKGNNLIRFLRPRRRPAMEEGTRRSVGPCIQSCGISYSASHFAVNDKRV